MGYDAEVRTALIWCGIRLAFVCLGGLCSAVMRGFEKVHWHARANVFGGLMDASFVIPTLLLGGDLRAALIAQTAAAGITLVLQISLVMRLRIGRPRIDRSAMAVLVGGGSSFLVLDLVLKAQPYIDATFLSRLSPPEALGWYSAANRIVGVLIFPTTTMTFALYPTLARLFKEDRRTYDALVRLGLRSVMILGLFAATGTVLFADVIVGLIYGKARFGPAAGDLGILSAYVLLVYSSMVLGTAIPAAGRQLALAGTQSLCLVVSLALDPVLIPHFQSRYGNGGLGVCIAVVVAEIAMVSAGICIMPRGALDRSLLRTLCRCAVAALTMAAAGLLLRSFPILAIPAAAAAYPGVLWLLRELDSDLVSKVRKVLVSKGNAAQESLG
jgi:O-antigen/teichoic acid export membrane protein